MTNKLNNFEAHDIAQQLSDHLTSYQLARMIVRMAESEVKDAEGDFGTISWNSDDVKMIINNSAPEGVKV